MSRSTDDADQLGLWPLTETHEVEKARRTRDIEKESPATTTSKPPHDTTASRRRPREATAPAQPLSPEEITHLWGIDEVSHYLAVSKNTIYGWRKTNYGPPAIRIGKHLRWRPETVIAWALGHEQ